MSLAQVAMGLFVGGLLTFALTVALVWPGPQ